MAKNPSPETPSRRSSPRALRTVRWRVALQILAALIVTISILTWSLGHYRRFDFSRSHKFELSNQSQETMWNLGSPAKITAYYSPSSLRLGAELSGDILAMLREYQFHAHHYRDLTVDRVDPTRDPARAKELQAKYKFSGEENVLIIDYKDRSTVIPFPEMGEYDTTPTEYGDRPRLIAFRGEQVLTSALIGLVEPSSNKKIYFLQGHGEALPGLPPFQLVGQNLKRQNLTASPLALQPGTSVPSDAALVIIAGAHFDLAPSELESLQTYWKAGGHLFVLLDPTGDTPELDSFLAGIGIAPRNDRVLRLVNLGSAMGILRDVTGEFVPGSEVTARLVGLNILFLGNTESLALEQNSSETTPPGNGSFRPLIQAVHGFWGCTDYANADGHGVHFDRDHDTPYPAVIAAMADLGGVRDDRVSVGASRAIVVGSSDFLKDKFLAGTGLDFFSSSINTLVDRTRLTGTTPKTKEFFTLNLDTIQLQFLALWTMMVVPLAAALIGGAILWRRRSGSTQ
jgi:hypothetical protein